MFSKEDLSAGFRLFEQPWSFLLSVADLNQLPPSGPVEIALAGRSNVGKSSLFNALVRQMGLARTSNTPGRTQQLNYYAPAIGDLYLVDMPGYGFAQAPKNIVEDWTALVRSYLAGRQRLMCVLLLIDARHGIKSNDKEIMKLLNETAVSFQIVLTKTDKVTNENLSIIEKETRVEVKNYTAGRTEILSTSSLNSLGIPDLRAAIAKTYQENALIKS